MVRMPLGQYKDETVARLLLRRSWDLFRLRAKQSDNPELKEVWCELDRLQRLLQKAPIFKSCAEPRCNRRVRRLTLPMGYGGFYPSPYFWCEKHGPWDKEGISSKLPIDFELVDMFWKRKYEQRGMHTRLREAFGIRKGTHITEEFAESFFRRLEENEAE